MTYTIKERPSPTTPAPTKKGRVIETYVRGRALSSLIIPIILI